MEEKAPIAVPIFPTMLYRARAPINIVNDDIFDKIDSLPYKHHKGWQPGDSEGELSQSSKVLAEYDFLESIKIWLDVQVINAFDSWGLTKSATPYITQSWFTRSAKGETIHKHSHPNSILSGVLYINAVKDYDCLMLQKPGWEIQYSYPYLHYRDGNEETEFSATMVQCQVQSGDLLIFPSNVTHWFNQVEHDQTRISLAFNTFIKGTLGDDESLTLLEI